MLEWEIWGDMWYLNGKYNRNDNFQSIGPLDVYEFLRLGWFFLFFKQFGYWGILGPPGNHASGWIRDLWLKGVLLILAEFRITPVNSGYYTLQIYPRVYVNMFRVKPRATLGLIFFTVLIQNSEKQWKFLSGCLEKVALGNSLGSSDFPLGLRPSGKSEDPREFPRATFSRQPLRIFHCLYHISRHFWFFCVLNDFFHFSKKIWVLGYSWSTLLWYWCYYPHRSRDALSPVCRIFFLVSAVYCI